MTTIDGPPGSFFLSQAIANLEARMVDHNKAMRADMNTGFRDLANKFDTHENRNRDFERNTGDRLARIETHNDEESKQVVKRSVWLAILATAGVNGVVEWFKHGVGK